MPPIAKAPALFFDDPLYWAACSLIIIAIIYVSIFFHELGHWILAKACGFRVLGFSVGEGRLLWRGRIGHGFIHLRLLPVEGYIIAVKESSPMTRAQQILLSSGGPLFTALMLAGMAMGYQWGNFEFLGPTWNILVPQILSVVMVLLGLSLLYNLWPHHGHLGGEVVANDGMAIVSAILSKHYPEPPWYRAKLQRAFLGDSTQLTETKGAGALLLAAWTHHLDGGEDQALSTATEALKLPGLTNHERAVTLSEAASFCPQTKPGLERALEFSEQAYALFPEIDHFACQLAFTQIRLRFYDRARQILDEVIDRTRTTETRASALCILALADAAQKRRDDGLKRVNEARRLSPCCPMLPIARSALLGGTAGFSGRQ